MVGVSTTAPRIASAARRMSPIAMVTRKAFDRETTAPRSRRAPPYQMRSSGMLHPCGYRRNLNADPGNDEHYPTASVLPAAMMPSGSQSLARRPSRALLDPKSYNGVAD